MEQHIKKNKVGNLKKEDVAKLNIRYKQWRQMKTSRQNRAINKHNTLIDILNDDY